MHDFVSYLFYLLQRGMRFAVPAALICGLILAVCYTVCRRQGRRSPRGEAGCAFGCLGFGDCVAVCAFDAIHINPETGLPEVDADKCTACGACVKACPKMIIELRKKWPKNRAVYVSCVSKDKGAVVMKACKAGCIGCGKCVKVCAFDAITVENNLAYIDPQKCKLCRKCVNECPTGAIRLVGMDPLPKAPKAPATPATPAAPKAGAAPKVEN